MTEERLRPLPDDPQYHPYTHKLPLSGALMQQWRSEVGRDITGLQEKVSTYVLSEYGVILHPEDIQQIAKSLSFSAVIDVMLPGAYLTKFVRLTESKEQRP